LRKKLVESGGYEQAAEWHMKKPAIQGQNGYNLK
jgi:hypothetical protein